MDADRFDALAKTVFGSSRRGLLSTVAALVGARAFDRPVAAAPPPDCIPVGKSCNLGPCCSGRCKNGVCARRQCEQTTECPAGLECSAQGDCICFSFEASDVHRCTGCCTGDRTACLPGTDEEACGGEGEPCGRCLRTQICANKRCCYPNDVPCGLDDQCCDGSRCFLDERTGERTCCPANRRCLVGDEAVCCEAGQRCSRGKCICNATKCAARKGCCKDDRCQRGDQPNACGIDGTACKTCPTGLDCDAKGNCSCLQGGNNRCAGCCNGTKTACRAGTSNTACGNHGERCQNCTAKGEGWTCKNRTCQQIGVCTPTATGCNDSTKRCCLAEAGADLCCSSFQKCCPPRFEGEAPTCCATELSDTPEGLVCCDLGSRGRCCPVGQSCCPADAVRDCCDTASVPNCCHGF